MNCRATTKPAAVATDDRKRRRLTFSMTACMVMASRSRAGRLHGRMDALVAAAAADVPGHGLGDLLVGGVLGRGQERRGMHDLATLAEAALRDVVVAPSPLDG